MGQTLLIKDNTHCITPLRSGVVAIPRLEEPRTHKECKKFCGLIYFLSMYLKNLQKRLIPIYNLTRKGVQLEWTEEHKKPFEELNRIYQIHLFMLCQIIKDTLPWFQTLVELYVEQISESYVPTILCQNHDPLLAGYWGMTRMYLAVKETFYANNLFNSIIKNVHSCHACHSRSAQELVLSPITQQFHMTLDLCLEYQQT